MSSAPRVAVPAQPIRASAGLTSSNSAAFTLFACGVFVVLGVVTTLLGPTLPLFKLRWSISAVQAGALFSWQFIFSTVGTLLSGAVLTKRSFKLATLLGVALCLFGTAALVTANWTIGRYAVACYGFGLGISLPTINLAVAEANRNRRAASVSLLNFAWGIGAIGGPVLLDALHSLSLFLVAVSVLLGLSFIASALSAMPSKTEPVSAPDIQHHTQTWLLVTSIAASMFLFCGVENAVGGWAASLALPSFSSVFAATSASIVFFTFFLAGRASAPVALRYLSETRLLLISIILAAGGVFVFYFAAHAITILLACALAGLGIGPGFPLLIARVSELIGPQHPASMVCFSFAGIGAATLPPLVGFVGARFAQPRAGLLLPLGGLLLLIPLSSALAKIANSTGNRPRAVDSPSV